MIETCGMAAPALVPVREKQIEGDLGGSVDEPTNLNVKI